MNVPIGTETKIIIISEFYHWRMPIDAIPACYPVNHTTHKVLPLFPIHPWKVVCTPGEWEPKEGLLNSYRSHVNSGLGGYDFSV